MDADVVIAGGGPTGLMLACELRLAGVEVAVLDRLAGRSGESRAGGIHARSMEVLDQRGLVDRFLDAGQRVPAGHFSALWLDLGRLETRYPFMLMILQSVVERLLEERAAELGARVRWSSEVTGVRQDDSGVEVEVLGPGGAERLRAGYLVGCDGGRSAVRRLAGIDFPGTPATMTAMLGDVMLTDPPAERIFQERREHGSFSVLKFGEDWYRVLTNEFDHVADRDAPVTFEGLREAFARIAGTDYGMHSPRWVSRFGDAARQAAEYRRGRVLLAGDAAHIHFPAGGQGLNLGLQDAVNLGWKIASVVHGRTPCGLLDSYHAERHPVAERVLHNTRAQTVLGRPGEHMTALREVLGGLIEFDDVNRSLGSMVTALDVRYPMGDGHPLLGRRVPDLDLRTSAGDVRLFELLRAARPVLLDLGADPGRAPLAAGIGAETGDPGGEGLSEAAEGWADRVDLVEAECPADGWALPDAGEVPAPAALLVRPDSHVAWAAPRGAAPDLPALRSALTAWFGPAR
ncbi:FAD-dependent monooxygenase [Streptosporangium carneum]|uniref:3-(3-hydroxyphenyl)propionate hydroxylase n=1 Tax=Streptosporangium carneum TaxID=47481 RepID=A0A9W6HY86_9ACTN|nr:FAD-dependent monooxygenase [Streptosporangium carneum]GLK08287.1 3-(3-hydroxyphenyl)propionate hydroxylase [Streptosporangium carneum]